MPSTPGESAALPFVGQWVYARDPDGAASFDPIYEGTLRHFQVDGQFTLYPGGTSFNLKGCWDLCSSTDNAYTVDIDYGEDRTTVYHLRPRFNDGKLTGMLVHESEEGDLPPQWWEPVP